MKFPITVGIRSVMEERSIRYLTREGRRNVHWVSRKTAPCLRCGHSNTLLNSGTSSCPYGATGSTISNQFHPHISFTPTLLIVANEYHLPQCCLILGQDRQVIPSLDLTRFVDDDSLYRDDLRESSLRERFRRQHAHCAKDDSRSQ